MQEFHIPSQGGGELLCRLWAPVGTPAGVVQLVHGVAEHSARYDAFAQFLVENGFAVVAEDHMGHGGSISADVPRGCFSGGWPAAAADVYTLCRQTQTTYPGVPYFLMGHSMGSFLARTVLIDHPDAGFCGAVLSGTAWQPAALLAAGRAMCRVEAKRLGQRGVSALVYRMAFGSYNDAFAPSRTVADWLSRDEAVVDAYCDDPLCGFVPSVGMLGDMMAGLAYNQRPGNLAKMNRDLPVYFMSGGQDPVGDSGRGVERSAAAFRRAGVRDVTVRIWPGGRHEMLNELNRDAVYHAVLTWLREQLPRT